VGVSTSCGLERTTKREKEGKGQGGAINSKKELRARAANIERE